MPAPPETRITLKIKLDAMTLPVGDPQRLEYIADEQVLIYHGVMTETERAKLLAMPEFSKHAAEIDRLFADSRRFFQVCDETLDPMPTDLNLEEASRTNEELFGRLQYSQTQKLLLYYCVSGPLTKADLDEFVKHSTDITYKRALERLRAKSRKYYNVGGRFLSFFKWVLLLLTAEVLKAIAGTFYDPRAALSVPGVPPIVFPEVLTLIARPDLLSLAKTVTTVLLLARYFACLVDPIWRSVGIYRGRAFPDGSWNEKLSRVAWSTLGYVASLSLLEFLLFFHAAKTADTVTLWLTYLWLLVLLDTTFFFALPVAARSVIWALHWIGFRVFIGKAYIASLRRHRLKWLHDVGLSSDPPPTEDIGDIKDKLSALGARIERAWEETKRSWNDYGRFNICDGICITTCLLLVRIPNGGEMAAVLTCTLLTLGISVWNFRENHDLYKTHMSVLTLSRA